MKKLMRLLAMTLAAAMLLSVGALAAENEDGGPRLVWNWLDWNEEGAYAGDDALSGRSYGDEEMHMAVGDDNAVIFFTIGEDGKRTPVIPKAGKGVTIEKLAKEEIASGAKQSKYYVHVRLDDWTDTELTSGKAAMKVVAELPDAGFYATAEATQKGYLRNDQQPRDPSQLTDNTAYFVSAPQDEYSRRVTDVKKSSNGDSGMFDLEKAGDNAWKITLKIPEDGGAWVNLDVTFRESDGRTYTEERGYGFEYPRGPELWHTWLDWNGDVPFLPEDSGKGRDFNLCPDDEFCMAFYTCDYDDRGNQTFTPVPVDKLKASTGLTITPLSRRAAAKDKQSDCYAKITVADWNKTYTISCGEYSLTVDSSLPDVGFYSKPEATPENHLRSWLFSTAPNENESVYMIATATDENNGRHLVDATLAKGVADNAIFRLENVKDNVYKLTRTGGINVHVLRPELELTWQEAEGGNPEPYTELCGYFGWAHSSLVASESPLPEYDRENLTHYDNVADAIKNSISLQAGVSKDVYVTFNYFNTDLGVWVLGRTNARLLKASNSALQITVDDKDSSKLTLSCNTAGTYTLNFPSEAQSYPVFYAMYRKDGTRFTDAEFQKWDDETPYYYENGKVMIIVDTETYDAVPFEEAFPDLDPEYEIITDPDWFPLTVTVTGEAPKPAFPDVAATAWYAPAVTFANSNGYMNGNADGTFNPDGWIKGSEFAQILYNKEGKPAAADGASFSGVTTQWYAPAILWAAGKGIVTDTGDTATAPEANLTRQQIALMLYNYMSKPAATADLSGFADADQISGWAREAMEWAVSVGVLKGSDNGGVLSLNPTGTATRAQAAQILMNFFG